MALVAQNARLEANWQLTSVTSITTASITPVTLKLMTLWVLGTNTVANSVPQPTVTDSSGRTWSFVAVSPYINGNLERWFLWTCVDNAASPAAGTVTVNFGATVSRVGWSIQQWNNANTNNNGVDAIAQAVDANLATVTSALTISLTLVQPVRTFDSIVFFPLVVEGANNGSYTVNGGSGAAGMAFGQAGGPSLGYGLGHVSTQSVTLSYGNGGTFGAIWAFEITPFGAVPTPASIYEPLPFSRRSDTLTIGGF